MRTLLRLLVATVVVAIGLVVLNWLLADLTITGDGTALFAAFVLCLVNALVWPTIARLALPISVVTVGLASLLLNALLTLFVLDNIDGITIDGFGVAVVVTIGLSITTTIVLNLLTIDDDSVVDERMIRQMSRRRKSAAAEAAKDGETGTVFVQIDGLALDVLRQALAAGDAPVLHKWVRDGSHHLVPWVTEWSSQTGVSQAGLLLGDTQDMPAFRWYEKDSQTSVVSNRPASAALIESRRLHEGAGLLADDGASYGNLYAGGAERAALTMSVVGKRKGRFGEGYGPYLGNPRNLVRTTMSAIADIAQEIRASRDQRRRDVAPRIHRSLTYAFMRSFTTIVMRDVCVHAVIGAMAEGRRRVYVDLLGYDEVAHHSGVQRHDAIATLRGIDRQIGRIDRAREWVARPYRIVVLSDHGQSQGATFLGRYGVTLEDVVREACSLPVVKDDDAPATLTETTGYLDSALGGVSAGSGVTAKVAGSARRKVTENAEPDLKDDEAAAAEAPVVMASGNLGLVYLPRIAGRATLEDLDETYPGLVETVRRHPGVGFVLVATRDRGSVVLGPNGTRWLAREGDDAVEGDDPLAPFGPHALDCVRRADGYSTVADLMVNSFYDTDTGEVAAFEELVGSHGGLGGLQSYPFVLAPAEWDTPAEPLFGAAEVHRWFMARLAPHHPPAA